MEEVIPELVVNSGLNGTKALSYQGIIPVVVEAVKELDTTITDVLIKQSVFIEKQSALIENLQNEISQLSARISRIEQGF